MFRRAYGLRFHFGVHVDCRHPVVAARRSGAVGCSQRRRTFFQIPRFVPVVFIIEKYKNYIHMFIMQTSGSR